MADVGDRVEVLSKAGTRQGKVSRVSGAMVTVEWDTGGQTTVIPAPGVMSVIGAARKKAAAKKKAAPAKKKAPARKQAAPAKKKKAAPAKKKKAAPAKKKAAPAKKKKAGPAKKAVKKKKR